jgi:enamine deaminase RidA (YjgF/YER057c/UK114 family)
MSSYNPLQSKLAELGKRAGSALKVAQIPLGACVEIEVIAEARD